MKGESNCLKCGVGNIIWNEEFQVEDSEESVTVSITGSCDFCGEVHYVIASGDIELSK